MNPIEALKAAGWTDTSISMAGEQEMKRMERFAQIIRNQALEDAAQVCDSNASMCSGGVMKLTLTSNAHAIRSMKKDQP